MTESALCYTVFTPTYNRAHTLRRVFDSLCAQTFRDFEWLVVDDGSTDNTRELIDSWAGKADFPVRYFRQENSGKHIAHNFAVQAARGEFFIILDSDDALDTRALERLRIVWLEIPAADRAGFCATGGLSRNQHGKLVGDPFPTTPFDASFRERVFVFRIRGEKGIAWRLDILRRFPFPEIAGTTFVPEGVIWLQTAKEYKIRFVNEIFRIYYTEDENTGATLSSRGNIAISARGRLYYYTWLLNNEMEYFSCAPMPFIKAAAMLPVVTRYTGQSLQDVWRELKGWRPRILVLAAYPLSLILRSTLRGDDASHRSEARINNPAASHDLYTN
jgi:glycosyltransferase involved in cell wall biosynthesis